VIYTRAITKDGGYAYAAKNFVNTYVSCTKLFFTQMPFWTDGKVTELFFFSIKIFRIFYAAMASYRFRTIAVVGEGCGGGAGYAV
jgi:hypothetical protein